MAGPPSGRGPGPCLGPREPHPGPMMRKKRRGVDNQGNRRISQVAFLPSPEGGNLPPPPPIRKALEGAAEEDTGHPAPSPPRDRPPPPIIRSTGSYFSFEQTGHCFLIHSTVLFFPSRIDADFSSHGKFSPGGKSHVVCSDANEPKKHARDGRGAGRYVCQSAWNPSRWFSSGFFLAGRNADLVS